jgi:hypothetical protein
MHEKIMGLPLTYARRILGLTDAVEAHRILKELSVCLLNELRDLPAKAVELVFRCAQQDSYRFVLHLQITALNAIGQDVECAHCKPNSGFVPGRTIADRPPNPRERGNPAPVLLLLKLCTGIHCFQRETLKRCQLRGKRFGRPSAGRRQHDWHSFAVCWKGFCLR